eukprot:90450-Chlamydomonas_euryale.AAC.2
MSVCVCVNNPGSFRNSHTSPKPWCLGALICAPMPAPPSPLLLPPHGRLGAKLCLCPAPSTPW